ncbi:MAG TPA: hypothetical protein VFI47_02695 [Acidimicrobiales bacterium]|nr:hypothetical protein [Acidimicrobiales bacterium]
MKRTITARAASRTMSLGDVRQFLASIESVPDEAVMKVRTTLWGRTLRSLTVEEDDVGFDDYMKAVGADLPEPVEAPELPGPDEPRRAAESRKGERAGAAR